MVQAVRHVRAQPGPLTGGTGGARPPSPGWLLSQEGGTDRGFAAAVLASEARDPERGAVSKLQARLGSLLFFAGFPVIAPLQFDSL
jgi:hypothetical protein